MIKKYSGFLRTRGSEDMEHHGSHEQQEQGAYHDYAKKSIFDNQTDICEYSYFLSEYSYRFHFGKRKNWGRTILDFGGRIGEKTRRLKNVTVVEIDQSAREWMRKNNIASVASLDEFDDGSVDAIYCSHVLEHLENAEEYLQKFHRKLRKGGVLIVVTPGESQTPELSAEFVDGINKEAAATGHTQTYNFGHHMVMLKRAGYKPVRWMLVVFPIFTMAARKISRFAAGRSDVFFEAYMDFLYWLLKHRYVRRVQFTLNSILRAVLPFSPHGMMELVVIASKE